MLPGQGVGNLVSLRRNQDTASRHDSRIARSAPGAKDPRAATYLTPRTPRAPSEHQ